MIHVGKISFQFKMTDEQFAKGLYANWNEFCQSCFTKILEECLRKYDSKNSYIEVDTLNLNIGSIEQKNFYTEFPKRLRTELERIILSTSSFDSKSSFSRRKRLENLIHYFKYGFCLPEWSMQDFDLFEELMFFKNEGSVFELCFSATSRIQRLFRQLDEWQLRQVMANPLLAIYKSRQLDDENEKSEWNLILSWLTSTAFGYYEKQRFFSEVLATTPLLVLRFIRETREDYVKEMALLLDSERVYGIIIAETGNHADVDIPEYWCHLYQWLIEYYPFNGVPMFGDKQHFVMYLHERFLFFIRKRSAYAYLSNGELTMRFLLEVFGTDYCYDVLNLLYYNQGVKEDGSPMNSDRFSREIYEILLKLSLLKNKGNYNKAIDNNNALDERNASADIGDFLKMIKPLEDWFMDNMISEVQKREFLTLLIKTQPQQVLCWLKDVKNINVLDILQQIVGAENVFTLVSVVSYNESSLLSSVYLSLNEISKEIPWMCKIGIADLEKKYMNLVAHWLVSDSSIRGIGLLKGIVWNIYKGVDVDDWRRIKADKNDSRAISEVLSVLARKKLIDIAHTEFNSAFFINDISNDVQAIVANIYAIIDDTSLSILAKRNLLLLCLDAHLGKMQILFKDLCEKKILTQVIEILDITVLRKVIMQITEETTKNRTFPAFVIFVDWIVLHASEIASIFTLSKTDLIARIIEQSVIRNGNSGPVELLMSYKEGFEVLAKWLSSPEVSDTEKSHLLCHYAHWEQFVFWDFVEYIYDSYTFDVQKFSDWIGIEDWLILIARISYSWAECLKQLTEKLQISDIVSEKRISQAIALFVARHSKDDWYKYNIMDIAKDYIVGLKEVAEHDGLKEESVVLEQVEKNILSELKISDVKDVNWESTQTPSYLQIGNAGLCLFAPWLLRLFGMLDLLNEKKNEFKNIDSKIRAIFILQRLVTAEERLYKETELAFNRLLVACPFNVPLPKKLELTRKEVETIESMLYGVKANWTKLKNTSVGGFQRSFIERDGYLEQQDKKWVLPVENKAYDILLDSLPWSYKTIRLPWLKKPIYVMWRNKEEFDNEWY